MEIGNRIKKIMLYKSLNYRTFGHFLGYSDVAISKIIKGQTKPKFDFLNAVITKIPEINPVWLLTGEGEMLKTAKKSPKIPDLARINALVDQMKTLKENAQLLREMLDIRQKEVATLEKNLPKWRKNSNNAKGQKKLMFALITNNSQNYMAYEKKLLILGLFITLEYIIHTNEY